MARPKGSGRGRGRVVPKRPAEPRWQKELRQRYGIVPYKKLPLASSADPSNPDRKTGVLIYTYLPTLENGDRVRVQPVALGRVRVVLLIRKQIGFGQTMQRKMRRQAVEYQRSMMLDPSVQHGGSQSGGATISPFDNPYGGQVGWELYATGQSTRALPDGSRMPSGAEAGREDISGVDGARRIRFWFSQLPENKRTHFDPGLRKGDPMRSSRSWRPWVNQDCIGRLIREASAGIRGRVDPVIFAIRTSQKMVNPDTGIPETIYPLRELEGDWMIPPGKCMDRVYRGITLEAAVRRLTGTRKASGYYCNDYYDDGVCLGSDTPFRTVIASSPEKIYELWRDAYAAVPDQYKAEVNAAYHRILLWRFLNRRKLTPGKGRGNAAIERNANLIQAYRAFVFNSNGCPVAINTNLLRVNGVKLGPIRKKKVPWAQFSTSGDRERRFGEWLFKILNKDPASCKTRIDGLSELLAAVDVMR